MAGEFFVYLFLFLILYVPVTVGLLISLLGRAQMTREAARQARIVIGLGVVFMILDVSANGFQFARLVWPLILVIIGGADLLRYYRENK